MPRPIPSLQRRKPSRPSFFLLAASTLFRLGSISKPITAVAIVAGPEQNCLGSIDNGPY
jgi:hypothetical protein